jgi:WhiB family redox-sensing transcriptional regulator
MDPQRIAELLESGQEIWQSFALCSEVDFDTFFPEKGGSTKEAKRICAECAVTEQCLEYAIVNDQRYGIWGGIAESERCEIRKAKAANRNNAG